MPGLPPPLSRTNVAAVKTLGHPGGEISGVSTNGALASSRDNFREATPESTEEEKPAPADAAMEESEHILVDYLSLLPHSNVATAVQ